MTRSGPDSRLHLPLISGFGVIIVILFVIWFSHQRQMDYLHQTVESGRVAVEKMEVIASLIEIARSRTRLTNKMLHTEDIFERDEIGLQLDRFAAEFARLRNRLLEFPLSTEEEEVLQSQVAAIRPTLVLQRKAAEMALSDDPQVLDEARQILIEEVYPGQGVIIDHFMRLLDLQKHAIDQAGIAANERYRFSRNMENGLTLTLLTLVLAIAGLSIRRSIKIEKALFLEKERAQITLRSIGDAVITTDRNGRVEYLNATAESIVGVLSEEVVGMPLTEVFRAYDEVNDHWLSDCVMRLLSSEKYSLPSNDVILYDHEGRKRDIALTFAPIMGGEHEVMGSVTTFHDVTETKNLTRRIEHQAQHDALTGLLNRNEFKQKVNQALELYSEDTSHALCVMDLDRFKVVNDSVGHAAGDELLRQLSRRIKDNLRKGDLLARIGGDEFAIFLSNVGQDMAVEVMENILRIVREFNFFWNGKSFRIGASMGLVDVPPEVSDYEYLYHAADTACYIAKHEGRDRLHVVAVDDEWLKRERIETQWINRINECLDHDQFVLYGQEITPLDGTVNKRRHIEVLIRMLDEDGGVVPPMAFIPAAERYNLMSRIDEWVLREVVRLAASDSGDTVYGINLSGQSMSDTRFTQQVMEILQSSGIDPSKLCFEITETAAIANLENAREFLNGLRALGCLTALDDFGSGLSSFAYLRNLPINYLKIDGMFIRDIATDEANRVMVEAIRAIGRTMQVAIVAEYVENETIAQTLREIGIDYGQGYFFGKPVPLQ